MLPESNVFDHRPCLPYSCGTEATRVTLLSSSELHPQCRFVARWKTLRVVLPYQGMFNHRALCVYTAERPKRECHPAQPCQFAASFGRGNLKFHANLSPGEPSAFVWAWWDDLEGQVTRYVVVAPTTPFGEMPR